MKRLNNEEKRQLGLLIHYYRNSYFRSQSRDAELYKQVNFCRDICSQAQLSRLENGEVLKDNEIYEALLDKLNLQYERIHTKDYLEFESYFEYILEYQNHDELALNQNEYVMVINKYQNTFKQNIIYTHYNYALEFIYEILSEDIEEAGYLLETVENTLEILPPKLLILTLHYLGKYYYLINNYSQANKYYLLTLEHMHKNKINNEIIYLDLALNEIKRLNYIHALDYLHKALNVFSDTKNTAILARIYQNYGLIYLFNQEDETAVGYFQQALTLYQLLNKKDGLIDIYNYLAVCGYFASEYLEALEYINLALDIKDNPLSRTLKSLINIKINKPLTDFNDADIYHEIVKFYLEIERDMYFEKVIEPKFLSYDVILRLIVLRELFNEYKLKKKYKKALELKEKYKI